MKKYEKTKEEQIINAKLTTRITGIVCITLLSFLSLIGMFWGKEGYINLGLSILIGCGLIILLMMIIGFD